MIVNKIAVIGELNVDLIASGLQSEPVLGQEIIAQDFTMAIGSASAIFACGIARLGNSVNFISKIGNDDFGKFCLAQLTKQSVSTEQIKTLENIKTGVTVVLSTPQDRAMVTYLGAIAELSLDDIELDKLNNYNHLHLTSYFLQTKLQSEFPFLMQEAKQRGLTVSFDPNSDPTQNWDEQIYEVIANTDILFINELEAAQLTGKTDLEEMLHKLAKYCRCVVIKLGAKGSIACKNGEVMSAEGFTVNSVDTTGAGDSFAAGFVHAYLNKKDLHGCLIFGNVCGALSTTKTGGTLGQPNLQQITDFLNQ